MAKILITAASGFAGSYLTKHLLERGETSIAATYLSDLGPIEQLKDTIETYQLDFQDKKAVEDLIEKTKPEKVYHLVALPNAGDSFKDPEKTLVNNIVTELNLLEALRKQNMLSTRVLLITSADTYGVVNPSDLPIDEDTPFHPASPYAVSKVAQDYLGLQYFLAYTMPIIRVRPFNHIGPLQTPSFAVPAFCRKIALIEKGKMEPVLTVGRIDTKRDFTDVRDMVSAYKLVMEKGKPGDVYNIGSGKSTKIEDILHMLLSKAKVEIHIKTDESLFRPNDPSELVCDNTKVKNLTDWEPKIPLEQTLSETLDYWRKNV